MRKWSIYAVGAILLSVLGGVSFHKSDVAVLKPVEVLSVRKTEGAVTIETDTGDSGTGANLHEALEDLKETTAGDVFLDTVDYLLLARDAESLLQELSDVLRPGCGVCICVGDGKLEEVAPFLAAHPLSVSLGDCRAEPRRLPILLIQEEMRLVESEN